MTNIETIKKAREIAKKSLRDCYFENGILASRNHFSDFWARDSFWAMDGILTIGDFDKAKDIFKLFLKYQKKNGKIPRKIMLEYALPKYLFKIKIKRRNPRPVYFGIVPPFHAMDDNLLLIIAFEKYIRKTQDKILAQKYYKQIKKAIKWYERKKSGGLLKEYFLSNWMDTILKSGKVLYTNALYFRALKGVSRIADLLEKVEDGKKYFQKSKKVKNNIEKSFWGENFYSSQVGDKKHFDTIGNTIVALYDIAPSDKIEKIIKKIQKIKENTLLPAVFPKYSSWKVNPVARIFGISDYHNGTSWLWIDLLAVSLEHKRGYKKTALKNFEKISEIILRDGVINETYQNDGKVYNKFLWKSAAPFAWNSGVFLKVFDKIFNKK